MQHAKLKLGFAATVAVMSVGAMVAPAFADYAPVTKDVVGVGSDTVQFASDFIADGDYLGDTGYNSSGNKYKIVNFDATPDANARLAYGPGGAYGLPGSSSTDYICGPGTGATAGTGNETAAGGGPGQGGKLATGSNHDETAPCVLNPTIVLRAGTRPVQRPNGSGAGAKAIATDTNHYISYTRASSLQGATLASASQAPFDRVEIGTDDLKMLAATTTNAVALSPNQLNAIYSCSTVTVGTAPNTTTRSLEWSDFGGTSSDTIVPYIPQVGSGTRSTFLSDIGLSTAGPGSCVLVSEENDPYAVVGNPDAISPVSSGRLNMFLGITPAYGSGSSAVASSQASAGYFRDPSCSLNAIAASAPSQCSAANNPLTPAVAYVSGTPNTFDNTGSLSKTIYDDNRGLYIYLRNSDVTSTTAWQPGSTENWARTLFYNPCPDPTPTGTDNCSTDPTSGAVYGPGGAPFYATASGQALIAAAGIVPTYAVVASISSTQ